MTVTAMRDGWVRRYKPRSREDAILLAGALRDSGQFESVFILSEESLIAVKNKRKSLYDIGFRK